jgi:hypothetical protein
VDHSQEIRDLVETLDRHRGFLLQTADGLGTEQARTRSTVSALTIASILKHVADTEEQWMQFAVHGTEAFGQGYDEVDQDPQDPQDPQVWAGLDDPRFVLSEAETLQVLRERVLAVGAATTRILGTTDLDVAHPLPRAPWVRARGRVVGAPGRPAHDRRDRPARGARRHHPGEHRRPPHHGLSVTGPQKREELPAPLKPPPLYPDVEPPEEADRDCSTSLFPVVNPERNAAVPNQTQAGSAVAMIVGSLTRRPRRVAMAFSIVSRSSWSSPNSRATAPASWSRRPVSPSRVLRS